MPLLAPGTIVARRYRVGERIATGRMAELYPTRGHGPAPLALKVLRPGLAADPRVVAAFQAEARRAALLSHPGIAQIHDVGHDGELCFLVTELIDGLDLRQVIGALARRKRRVPRALVLRVLIDVCRALHHAHTLTGTGGRPLGIVHHAVSLENILLGRAGQVKLTDFGIARACGFRARLEYVAPELIAGREADHRVDVYAAGVVLYLLLLGRAPFFGDDESQLRERILLEPPPAPRGIDPALPVPLERVLLHALEKDPGARFTDARQMATALEQAQASVGGRASVDDLARFVAAVPAPSGRRRAREPVQDPAMLPTVPVAGTDPAMLPTVPVAGTDPAMLPTVPVAGTDPANLPTVPVDDAALAGRPTEPYQAVSPLDRVAGLSSTDTEETPRQAPEDPTEEVDPANMPTLPVPDDEER